MSASEVEKVARAAWMQAVTEAGGWNPYDTVQDAYTDGFADGAKWALSASAPSSTEEQ